MLPKWAQIGGAILALGTTVGVTWATANERANARIDTVTAEVRNLREELRGGVTGLGSEVATLRRESSGHSVHLAAVDVRLGYCCPAKFGRLLTPSEEPTLTTRSR